MNFKITWNKDELKREGYNVYDVTRYLTENHSNIDFFNSKKILIETIKSAKELYEDLKNNFSIEFILDVQ